MNKENIENAGNFINIKGTNEEIEIPYNDIQKASTIDRAKTSPVILGKLIEEITNKLNTTKGISKALIYGILHSGGTAIKASPNHTFNLQYKGTPYFLDLQTLKTISEKIAKETNTKFTLRQIARTHEQDILLFATKLNLKGNLNKKTNIRSIFS